MGAWTKRIEGSCQKLSAVNGVAAEKEDDVSAMLPLKKGKGKMTGSHLFREISCPL